MTCPHCGGPVDVSTFNGRKLRCGCGKTIEDNPGFRPPDPFGDLRELFAMLKQYGVQSFSKDGLTVVFESRQQNFTAAITPNAEPELAPEKQPLCGCGHLMPAEHSEAGCIHGCALELCEQSLEAA